ncbi:hypothetical protein [Halocella sp. SP3-1]|uniref:hypothetical protein n=1 Tax=Halocella sp. SP3-1 TaxID=2382161 RepID=UPI00197A76E4|nr:hypothetical protein [Halocella sp. SP3-1]
MELIAEKLSDHNARLESLEKYEKKQNGSLQRMETKVDKLLYWLLASTFTIVMFLIGLLVKLKG